MEIACDDELCFCGGAAPGPPSEQLGRVLRVPCESSPRPQLTVRPPPPKMQIFDGLFGPVIAISGPLRPRGWIAWVREGPGSGLDSFGDLLGTSDSPRKRPKNIVNGSKKKNRSQAGSALRAPPAGDVLHAAVAFRPFPRAV